MNSSDNPGNSRNLRADWAAGGALRKALSGSLDRHFGNRRRIAHLDHRPSACGSSYPIEELRVELEGGAVLAIMFKDLSEPPPAKPAFLHDPEREIRVYEQVLPDAGLETAICYGALRDERRGRYGLFLEKVAGRELFQIGQISLWRRVARRLAQMHADFAPAAAALEAAAVPLLRCDRQYFSRWPSRALAQTSQDAKDRVLLERLAGGYHAVIERLTRLPATMIHGEFYASNVLLRDPPEALRVCPVDWEMAALGPGLIDLACLVGGRWSDTERMTLAMSYRDAAPASLRLASAEAFVEALDCCRLHLALQWLGWSPGFSPPPEHRHDWLREALDLAARIGL